MGNQQTSNQNKKKNVLDRDVETLKKDSQGNKLDDLPPARPQNLYHRKRCLQCGRQINQIKSNKLIGELKEIIPEEEDFQEHSYKTSEPFCSKICRTNYEYDTLEDELKLQAQQVQQARQAQQAQQALQALQAQRDETIQSVEEDGYFNSSDEEKEDTNSMKGKPKIRDFQKRVFKQNKKKKQILAKKKGGKKKRKRKTKKKKNKKRGYRGKSTKKKKTKKHRGKFTKKKKTKKKRIRKREKSSPKRR